MNKYEELLQDASDDNVRVYESFDLNGDDDVTDKIDGLYIDGNIALDKDLQTSAEKVCVLSEELGHHHTSFGNIIDMQDIQNIKQERKARVWAYDKLIGLTGLIRAYERHCQSQYEVAEYLNVTEEFLCEALNYYRARYGEFTTIDHYIVRFIPALSIAKLF